MTKVRHVRTVEIVTFTVTCDHCGEAPPTSGRDALHRAGWTLGASEDVCPDCRHGIEQEEARQAADAALARFVAELERGDVPLVHGRVYAERGA